MADGGATLRLADDVADTVAFSLVEDALRQNEVSKHCAPICGFVVQSLIS
jgi:hypothetical protein